MNLLLVERQEIDANGVVVLADRRAEHLLKVLKVEPGRPLRVGVIDGALGAGVVLAVEGPKVRLQVEEPEGLPPPATVDLIVALPRPQALHRLVQWSATMGVGRLDLVNAWRVEKSFFSSPSVAPEQIRRHLLLGAEQGRTTRLPEVHVQKLLVPFLEELGGPEVSGSAVHRMLAHPNADHAIEEVWSEGGRKRVQVAIGPEGGWIDREVETFGQAGFKPVSLGPWILRVETAVAAALAQVELLQRMHDGSRMAVDGVRMHNS
jgi:RsmE family RNA methyltransferase